MSTMNMKQDDHPAHDMPDATEQYAGDVLPIRPGSSMNSDIAIAGKQLSNEKSMSDIANRGPSSVDTSNLKLFKRK